MKHSSKLTFPLIIILIILTSFALPSCGIPQDQYDEVIDDIVALNNLYNTVIAEKDALQGQYDTVIAEKNTLRSELDKLVYEKDDLQNQLDDIKALYPLKGFNTLSEFKDWISDHVQPETTYASDAFLAAYKVQQAGMDDGYLIGLDIDTSEDGEEIYIYISVFVGNELYWWYVEDAEVYGDYGLRR